MPFSATVKQKLIPTSDLVMYQLVNHPEIKNIAFQTLQPLINYKSMDLLETLSAFIKYRGNVSRTARKINLHRQSLLYRLQKIEKLIDRSLDNPNDLFLLDLSMRLYRFDLPFQQSDMLTTIKKEAGTV